MCVVTNGLLPTACRWVLPLYVCRVPEASPLPETESNLPTSEACMKAFFIT